jgi:hypothetical protein
MSRRALVRLTIAGVLISAMTAHADWWRSGHKWANHSLEYGNVSGENKDIELLNYQYGESDTFKNGDPKIVGSRPTPSELATGHIPQGTAIHGGMPVADFLFVKWRILSTGKEYEDRVDLKSRLPSDMEGTVVHFNIEATNLNVYVIEKHGHITGKDCPIRLYQDRGCTRIYPDHWKNF